MIIVPIKLLRHATIFDYAKLVGSFFSGLFAVAAFQLVIDVLSEVGLTFLSAGLWRGIAVVTFLGSLSALLSFSLCVNVLRIVDRRAGK